MSLHTRLMLFAGLLSGGTALAGLVAVIRWGVDPWAAVAIFVTVSLLADIPLAWVANRARPLTGAEGMLGGTARVESGFEGSPSGRVRWRSELWNARLRGSASVRPGDEVTIVAVLGLRLEIEVPDRKT